MGWSKVAIAAVGAVCAAGTVVAAAPVGAGAGGSLYVYEEASVVDFDYISMGTATGLSRTESESFPVDPGAHDCIVLSTTDVDWTPGQLTALTDYVNAGGRLIAVGEQTDFAGANAAMNAVASAVGSGLSLVTESIDSGFNTTTNVRAASPYSDDVASIRFGNAARVAVSGSGVAVLGSATGDVPIVGAEQIGRGHFVLFSDSNILSDNSDNGYSAHDNGVLADNLCSAPIANEAPVADAGDDQTVSGTQDAPVEATLDGTGSTDPDGDVLAYEWSGPFEGGTASGPSPTVSFADVGDHVVTLTVIDPFGAESTDTVIISVVHLTDDPPSVTSTSTTVGDVGSEANTAPPATPTRAQPTFTG